MTWNQGDQKAKNLLLSETKQRCRLTAVKANSAVWFRWKSLFSDFAPLSFTCIYMPVARARANHRITTH
jgi:hypothetical protein